MRRASAACWAASAGSPPACACASTIEREADTNPAAGCGVRRAEQRLERVAAEQRICGEGVGAEAWNLAERPFDRADEGLPISLRALGDIAALAVGQHQQVVLVSEFDRLLECGPAM